MQRKILLFGHARSGTSNIYEILHRYSRLRILVEPFNENFVKWYPDDEDYRSRVTDVSSFKEIVVEILQAHDGFKLLQYQLERDLLEYLLLDAGLKIVFNRRRNLLQTVVSALIAHQTGVWGKWSMRGSLESNYSNLAPLDLEDIRQRIAWLSARLDWCSSILDRTPDGCTFRISYEDFYFATFAEQATILADLCDFVGVQQISAREAEYFLRPKMSKLNSPTTYAMVPNIQQVNDECGSEVHGWLF